MGLFKWEKIKIDWTKETAPKQKQIQLELSIELLLKGSSEIFTTYGDVRLGKSEIKQSLLSNSDSNKESLKEEIAGKLEVLYENLCKVIDNDEVNLSNEFWYNNTLETNKI